MYFGYAAKTQDLGFFQYSQYFTHSLFTALKKIGDHCNLSLNQHLYEYDNQSMPVSVKSDKSQIFLF